MSGVTHEMILEYIQRKGGRVKNVDLVRHFRKHLLFDDPLKKDQAREVFKETVNSIAFIKQEEGEKFLYLKDEYKNNSSPPSKVNSTTSRNSQLMENSSYKANVPSSYEPVSNYSVQKPPVPSPSVQKPPAPSPSVHQKPPVPSPSVHQKPPVPSPSVHQKPPVPSPSAQKQPVHVPSPSVHHPPVPSPSVQKPSVPLPCVHQPPVPSPSGRRKPPVPPPSVHQKPPVPSPSGQRPVVTASNVQPTPSAYTSPTRPISSAKDVLVSNNSMASVPTRLQNGGTSYDLEPEQKTVSPRHVPNKKPPTGSPSKSTNNRFFSNKNYSPSHQATKYSSSPNDSPVFSRATPLSTSFPTSSFISDYGSHNHSPIHQSGGKGHKKMSLEISSPMNVQSLSNGTVIMAESSDLQQVMSDLENFGKTGLFNDDYSSTYHPSNLSDPPHFSHHPPSLIPSSSHIHSSENSSLSSSSMHSTSSPPSDRLLSPIVKITNAPTTSEESQLGVRALIQQYGAVPSLSPEKTGGGNKAQRSPSSASAHSSDLRIRREPTPPDSRVQRSHSNVVRRPKGLERNSNLGTLTRESIRVSGAHTFHRLSKNSDELVVSNSKEELLTDDQDRDSPIDEYVIEIDPMEKEWMASLIDGNIDAIHHMLMSDGSYVNKRGFLHGWTALHWAARLGNAHLIQAIMFSGGRVDIKSNGGSTPLHLAAEAGHYKIIELLVNEYNAPVTARDYCGLRPLDVVDTWAPNSIKSVLRRGLPNRGLTSLNGGLLMPPPGTFGTLGARHSTMQWGSVPQLSDKEEKKGGTKNIKKGISFRRKKNYDVKKKGNRNSTISEYYEPYGEP